MRKDFGSQSWLYPMPVLIIATYDESGTPNAMNAAWGGIHDTDQIGICIDPAHKTAKNLLLRKAFTVSVGDAAHLTQCDYLGLVSGNREADKVAKAGLHTEHSRFVDAPLITEFPMTLECRLLSYQDDCGCAVGEIVNISADESILDEKGNIDPDKFEPISFDPVHHLYRKLGAVAGRAFQAGIPLK